jgi:hypothetical protein
VVGEQVHLVAAGAQELQDHAYRDRGAAGLEEGLRS